MSMPGGFPLPSEEVVAIKSIAESLDQLNAMLAQLDRRLQSIEKAIVRVSSSVETVTYELNRR